MGCVYGTWDYRRYEITRSPDQTWTHSAVLNEPLPGKRPTQVFPFRDCETPPPLWTSRTRPRQLGQLLDRERLHRFNERRMAGRSWVHCVGRRAQQVTGVLTPAEEFECQKRLYSAYTIRSPRKHLSHKSLIFNVHRVGIEPTTQ